MSDFSKAIDKTLENEGGYVNDPKDPGGETNFGISKHSYPTLDIKNLTKEQAKTIYLNDFWNRYGYSRIIDQKVAGKVFDTAVNMGPHEAHEFLYVAVRLPITCHLDDETIKVVNVIHPDTLLQVYISELVRYYNMLIAGNSHLKKFTKGWMRRALSV